MRQLTVGVPHRGPSVVTLPMDFALGSARLREADLAIRIVEGSYSELSSWLSDGTIDLCRRGPDVDVVARSTGAPIASCAALMQRAPAQFVVNGSITTMDQMAGRRVAVIDPTMGSTLALRTWLFNEGIDPEAVTFEVHGSTPQRLAAVASGAVAGTLLTAPGASALPDGVRVAADLDEALGPFLFSAIQVRPATGVERMADMQVFLAAVMDAVDEIANEDITERVAELWRVDADQAAEVLRRARRNDWFPKDLAFDHASANEMLEALQRFGYVEDDVEVADWIWDEARAAAVASRQP